MAEIAGACPAGAGTAEECAGCAADSSSMQEPSWLASQRPAAASMASSNSSPSSGKMSESRRPPPSPQPPLLRRLLRCAGGHAELGIGIGRKRLMVGSRGGIARCHVPVEHLGDSCLANLQHTQAGVAVGLPGVSPKRRVPCEELQLVGPRSPDLADLSHTRTTLEVYRSPGNSTSSVVDIGHPALQGGEALSHDVKQPSSPRKISTSSGPDRPPGPGDAATACGRAGSGRLRAQARMSWARARARQLAASAGPLQAAAGPPGAGGGVVQVPLLVRAHGRRG